MTDVAHALLPSPWPLAAPRRPRPVATGRLLLAACVAAGLCALLPSAGHADTRVVDLNQFQQNDLRSLAMGNAAGAMALGEQGLYYNPAGLAQYGMDFKLDGGVTIIGQQGNFATDTYGLVSNGSGVVSAPSVLTYLNRYDGTTNRYLAQVQVSAIANVGDLYFGAGAGTLDTHRFTFQFNSTGVLANDSLLVSDNRAFMSLTAAGVKLFGGKAFLGLTSKTVNYSEESATLPFSTIIANNKLDLNLSGTSYKAVNTYDVGFLYRVEWLAALRPQWSLVGYNVNTATLDSGTGQKLSVPASFNAGLQLSPNIPFVHSRLTLEWEDLSNAITVQDSNGVNQPRDLLQHTHAGFEIGLIETPTGNNVLSLRVGDNRGLLTYGAEINGWGALRLVYTHGADNLGYKDHPDYFNFDAYQVVLGIAF